MKILRVLVFISVFVGTWLVVARLFGQTTFTRSDLISMVIAAISAEVVILRSQRRLKRKAG